MGRLLVMAAEIELEQPVASEPRGRTERAKEMK